MTLPRFIVFLLFFFCVNCEFQNDTEDAREKRALGVILQAFGYAPMFQLGSLPTTNTTNDNMTYIGLIGRVPPASSTTQAAPITYPPGSTIPLTVPTISQLTYPPLLIPRPVMTTAKPPKPAKETLKFTGFVNFGNQSNLVGHLQQYEQLFHGSTTPAPPTYSPAPPRLPFFPHNSRFEASKGPVKVPLSMNFPEPPEPFKESKELEYRNKESSENYTVESKELSGSEEVSKVPYRGSGKYERNPHWDIMYKNRISELKKQMEDKSAEEDKRRTYQKTTSSESSEGQFDVGMSEAFRYQDNSDEEPFEKKRESKDDYFYSKKPLPLNYNRKRIKPSETLRNSYGEQLESKSDLDERIENHSSLIREKKRPWRHRSFNHDEHKQANTLPHSKSRYEEYELANENRARENRQNVNPQMHRTQNIPQQSLYIVHATPTREEKLSQATEDREYLTPRTHTKSKERVVSSYFTHPEPKYEKPWKPLKSAPIVVEPKHSKSSYGLPYFNYVKHTPYLKSETVKMKEDNIESFEDADPKEMDNTSRETSPYYQPLVSQVNQEESREMRASPPPFDDLHEHSGHRPRLVTSLPVSKPTEYSRYEDSYEDERENYRDGSTTTKESVRNKGYLLVHPNEGSGKDDEEINTDVSSIDSYHKDSKEGAETGYDDFSKGFDFGESDEKKFQDYYKHGSGEYRGISDEYDSGEATTKADYDETMSKVLRKMDIDMDDSLESQDDDDEELLKNAKTNVNNKRMVVTKYEIRSTNTDDDPKNKSDSKKYEKYNLTVTEFVPLNESLIHDSDDQENLEKMLNSREFGMKIKDQNETAAQRRTIKVSKSSLKPKVIEDSIARSSEFFDVLDKKLNYNNFGNKNSVWNITEEKELSPGGRIKVRKYRKRIVESKCYNLSGFVMEDLLDVIKTMGVGVRPIDDPFFEDSYKACNIIRRTGISLDDEEELCHTVMEKFRCNIIGCKEQFQTLFDYEIHYNGSHRYVCQDCKKTLPTPRILDIHIQESHDSFFQVLAEKQPMYQCFVSECDMKFLNTEDRRAHCTTFHKFPKKFRYDEPIKSKSKSRSNSEGESMETDQAVKETLNKPKKPIFNNKSKPKAFSKFNDKCTEPAPPVQPSSSVMSSKSSLMFLPRQVQKSFAKSLSKSSGNTERNVLESDSIMDMAESLPQLDK